MAADSGFSLFVVEWMVRVDVPEVGCEREPQMEILMVFALFARGAENLPQIFGTTSHLISPTNAKCYT
jgi:hypothetical protein